MYTNGQIDRLVVVYTKFISGSRQEAVAETLLPMTTEALGGPVPVKSVAGERTPYEFLPEARSILSDLVPISFKVRLFKCFLDAAVSEQIARRVAMRGATENADDMIKVLTRSYNRARQTQITRELSEIIGAAAALQ
jgi:F-type H+-transporting ATPase subunit gamma